MIIADDCQIVRNALKQQVGHAVPDAEINECEDGKSALEKIKEQHEKTDLVILDGQMPFMDGLEVLAEVRQYESLGKLRKKVPILCIVIFCLLE